jgi:hypothetical protein
MESPPPELKSNIDELSPPKVSELKKKFNIDKKKTPYEKDSLTNVKIIPLTPDDNAKTFDKNFVADRILRFIKGHFNYNINDIKDSESRTLLRDLNDPEFFKIENENNYNEYFKEIFNKIKIIYDEFDEICFQNSNVNYNNDKKNDCNQNIISKLKTILETMRDFKVFLKILEQQHEDVLPTENNVNEFTLTFKKMNEKFILAETTINKKKFVFPTDSDLEFYDDIKLNETVNYIKDIQDFGNKLNEFKNYIATEQVPNNKPSIDLMKELKINLFNKKAEMKKKKENENEKEENQNQNGGKTIKHKKRNKNITRKYK